jgi:alkyl hydroperoxide reductase subunit AhpC
LVLFFYALDFTTVWPTELTGFSKRSEEFANLNADLLSVSVDSEHSHKAWIESSLGPVNYLWHQTWLKKYLESMGF